MANKILPYKQFKRQVIRACDKTAKKHKLSKRDRRLLKLIVFSCTMVGSFREEK